MKGRMTIFTIILLGLISWTVINTKKSNITFNYNLPDSLYPSPDKVVLYHTKWAKNHYRERINFFKVHPLKMHDIVFIGNSIIEQGGDWGTRFGNTDIKNRGISGDVTEGVFNRLGEICFTKPKAVFILCGINDLLAYKSVGFVVNNTLKIVHEIKVQSPATKIYVQSILPTDKAELIIKIKEINFQLKNKAITNSYTFIDLHSLFADSNDLIKTVLTYDGTHPTDAGYKMWVNNEKELMNQLINNHN